MSLKLNQRLLIHVPSILTLSISLSLFHSTVHGFAARPDLSNEKVKAGFEGAFNDSVAFFEKHLLSTPTSSAAAPQPTSTETPAAVQTEATQATEA